MALIRSPVVEASQTRPQGDGRCRQHRAGRSGYAAGPCRGGALVLRSLWSLFLCAMLTAWAPASAANVVRTDHVTAELVAERSAVQPGQQPADRAAAAAHPEVAHLLAQPRRFRAADDDRLAACRPAPRSARSNGRRPSACRSARWSTTATKANCCCRCASPRRPTPAPAASCACAPRPTGWCATTCASPKARRWSCCCRWWRPTPRPAAPPGRPRSSRLRRCVHSRCRAGPRRCSARAASCC